MSKIIGFKDVRLYTDDEINSPFCYLLKASLDTREVTTNCGDFYYDISIDLDDFIKFAKEVEEQDKIYNKGKKNETQE